MEESVFIMSSVLLRPKPVKCLRTNDCYCGLVAEYSPTNGKQYSNIYFISTKAQ